ncbi:MAG: L-threonylcarbamoyladenylate synthase [Planctomycetaceae bacterium]|nr:threonylcarbamoyl-AMP synthase [Planctomycetaceae bacterium]
MKTDIIHHDSHAQIDQAALQGVQVLQAGGLVGFATETVYGVAALATLPDAMERLRILKDRPKRPFSVHMGSPQDLRRYVTDVPPDAQRLIDRAWPGPVTLVLPAGSRLADGSLQERGLYDVLCSEGTIGLRCPSSALSRRMLSLAAEPVVASSANLAGGRSATTAQDALETLDGRIDLLIDSGPTRYAKDSTIVQFSSAGGWKMLREGVVDEATLAELTSRTILFICTGNTCRSPIAEGLARMMLAAKLGCRCEELPRRGYRVLSAGIVAPDGARATPEAIDAAAELGADISAHRSTSLTGELASSADILLCMSPMHVDEVRRIAPSAVSRTELLDEDQPVSDPLGGGSGTYRQAARQIARALAQRLEKGQL